MRRSSILVLLFVALSGATLASAGCLSPTLPLPPPETPEAIRMNDDGTWLLLGSCSPGALVSVLRERDGVGVLVEDRDADGAYGVSIAAERCDVVILRQTDGEETSGTIRVVLQPTEDGAPLDTSACVR